MTRKELIEAFCIAFDRRHRLPVSRIVVGRTVVREVRR